MRANYWQSLIEQGPSALYVHLRVRQSCVYHCRSNNRGRRLSMKNMNGNRKARKNSNAGDTLESLYAEDLRDIYWAEEHLLKALPKMARAADSAKLKAAFQHHLTQTQGHVARIVDVFTASGIKPSKRKCEGIEGLTKEGEEVIQDHEAGSVRDAGLIVAAQKVEHYEISAYGSLRNLARTMGLERAAELLQASLDEEAETDKTLSMLSETVNERAFTDSETMKDRIEEELRG